MKIKDCHPVEKKVTLLIWDWGAKSACRDFLLLSSEDAPKKTIIHAGEQVQQPWLCSSMCPCLFVHLCAFDVSSVFHADSSGRWSDCICAQLCFQEMSLTSTCFPVVVLCLGFLLQNARSHVRGFTVSEWGSDQLVDHSLKSQSDNLSIVLCNLL